MFVIYTHREEDGSVAYVGQGKPERPYSLSRSTAHKEWMCAQYQRTGGEPSFIRVEMMVDTRAEALAHEAALIRRLNPTFNMVSVGHTKNNPVRRERRDRAQKLRNKIEELRDRGIYSTKALARELTRLQVVTLGGGMTWSDRGVENIMGRTVSPRPPLNQDCHRC